jgi:hypothetical protein
LSRKPKPPRLFRVDSLIGYGLFGPSDILSCSPTPPTIYVCDGCGQAKVSIDSPGVVICECKGRMRRATPEEKELTVVDARQRLEAQVARSTS